MFCYRYRGELHLRKCVLDALDEIISKRDNKPITSLEKLNE